MKMLGKSLMVVTLLSVSGFAFAEEPVKAEAAKTEIKEAREELKKDSRKVRKDMKKLRAEKKKLNEDAKQ